MRAPLEAPDFPPAAVSTRGYRAADAPSGPGDSGVWMFIVADMAMFALFFLVFTSDRTGAPALYEASRLRLNPTLGLINTLILLTSGWLMVQAVHQAKSGDRARTRFFLILTMMIGSGFAVTKIVEYAEKARAGISMLTNDFFMYYFVLTGIHFVHFLMGMIALAVMLSKARSEPIDRRYRTWIESVGCYWHMVDLLWIMLFPLLYLQRSA